MAKTKEMTDFLDVMSESAFGRKRTDALKEGTCVSCGEVALPKCSTDAGRREFAVSGLCEECFDGMFAK